MAKIHSELLFKGDFVEVWRRGGQIVVEVPLPDKPCTVLKGREVRRVVINHPNYQSNEWAIVLYWEDYEAEWPKAELFIYMGSDGWIHYRPLDVTDAAPHGFTWELVQWLVYKAKGDWS